MCGGLQPEMRSERIGRGDSGLGHGEAEDAQRGVEVGVVGGDGGAGGIAQGEGLEDGPVFDRVAVARTIENAIESVTKDDQRSFLRELAGAPGLQGAGVDLREADRDGGRGELAAKVADPLGRVDIGVLAIGVCGADEPGAGPAWGDGGEGGEVVLTFNLSQLGEERKIRPEAGESFQKASEALRGGVDDAVVGLGIVEAIAEGAVGVSVGPVGRLPWIRPAADAVQRSGGRARF